jgi:UDP-N-acetylmuramyl pentapeptide phosphotransferase/UDP-N-acetylglucosamine-1-phosphate transferase
VTLAMVVGLVAALALVVTAAVTPVVRAAALGAGLVRQAQADRWHRRPTPAIGGVAIYLGFGVALGVGYLLSPDGVDPLAAPAANAVIGWAPREGLLAAGTLIFLVGLIDDLVVLKPLQKLSGQVAAAAVLVLSGIGVWATGSRTIDDALSIFWFVGIANAMNLLDNMDGLASGIAAIAAGYLSLLLVAMLYLSVGTLVSTLTSNQTLAFIGTFLFLFLVQLLTGGSIALPHAVATALAYVSTRPRLEDFGRGIIDTSHIVFFLSIAAWFLVVAYVSLQTRRWR